MPGFQTNPLDLRICLSGPARRRPAGSTGLVAGGTSTSALSRGPTNSGGQRRHQHSHRRQFGAPRQRGLQSPAPASSAFPNGGQVPLSAFSHVETDSTCPSPSIIRANFPVVTLSFNLAPGASLGEAVKAVNRVKDELGLPAEHSGGVSGHGAGVPSFARQRAGADSGGAGDGLHRAGRAVRELHPSDHDSVHAAFGRRRRAAGAA